MADISIDFEMIWSAFNRPDSVGSYPLVGYNCKDIEENISS